MTDPERKKSFLSIFEKLAENQVPEQGRNGHAYPGLDQTKEPEEEKEGSETAQLLTEQIDHQILMHRDAHFGGDFKVMLDYYSDEDHVGIQLDFDLDRIAYLAEVEKEIGQDLAPLMLNAAEAESVGKARLAYAQLKEIYEIESNTTLLPRLIADLVLSEEEEPLETIEAVVSQGTSITADLIALVKSDEMYDPLYPGYGYAPYLAILCLGQIGDARAIIPIFETLSRQLIFDEMVIIEALASIGEPAKEFLLQVIKSRPLTQDNLNAAFALIAFSQDTQVAIACFEQLKDQTVQEKPLLRTYLLDNCYALKITPFREDFIKMSDAPNILADLRSEMKTLIEEWETAI